MKKITIILGIIIAVLISSYVYFWPKVRFQLAAEAAGGFPFQIALTGVMQLLCTPSCNGGCCMGGTLCPTKTAAQCPMYTQVSGTPSGGDGAMALFLNSNLASAGVAGELIAGGSTMTEMDSGVLAGVGGCTGTACVGINNKNILEKFVEIGKYIMAGFKK